MVLLMVYVMLFQHLQNCLGLLYFYYIYYILNIGGDIQTLGIEEVQHRNYNGMTAKHVVSTRTNAL